MKNLDTFPSEGRVFEDLIRTLFLLYSWIYEKEWSAQFELSQKYKSVSKPKDVGKAFRIFSERLRNENMMKEYKNENDIIFTSEQTMLLLRELDESCDNGSYCYDSIPDLKKKIKHSKNLMEKKMLEKQLNELYKERKRR